jgi:acyl-CoA reductase-like NAD-dependent aldehyde dehydrogenase
VLGSSKEVGDVLVVHPQVDAITFTGSNAVGKAIQLKATERGKKVQLELGGKNPAVVLGDADLALAADQVARGAFMSAGQKCTATSRVIIEQSVAQEFAEQLVALARQWKLGDPLLADTRIGPLVSEERLHSVMAYIEEGKAGGRLLAGGSTAREIGGGYYVRPTVLTDVDPKGRIAQDELFGPVAVLLVAKTYAEALALANDTPFGLSASVFTNDLAKALRFVEEAQAGVIKINQETAGLEFQVPFGGMKDSSSGSREQGKAAREFFTQWKTVYIDTPHK